MSINYPDSAVQNTPVEMDNEDSTADNPATLSMSTVLEMFNNWKQELKKDITAIHTEVSEMKIAQNEVKDNVVKECVQKAMIQVEMEIPKDKNFQKIRDQVSQVIHKNKVLTDTVDRMATEINDLKARIENIEVSGSKRAITLSGFTTKTTKKYELMAELEEFFAQFLGLSVKIDDVYPMGTSDPKLIVIYFQNMQDKRDTMRFKYLLKGVKNEKNRPLFINEYLPAATQEKRKRERQLINDHPNLEVKYSKGGLQIQNELYRPKIQVPTPKDIVNIDPQELRKIMQLPLYKSDRLEQNMSIFQAFTASVDSFEDVRKLYLRMKISQPDARHIVCAYNIPNETDPNYYTQNFCDDGEPGAGKTVLDFLKRNDLEKRVIFVARKYGGIKMGADRFECYENAAKMSIMKHPWNSILKVDQNLKPQPQSTQRQEEQVSSKTDKKREAPSPLQNEQPKRSYNSAGRGGQSLSQWRRGRGNTTQHVIRGARTSTQRDPNPWTRGRRPTSPRQQELNKFRDWSGEYQHKWSSQSDWADPEDAQFYKNYRQSGSYDHFYRDGDAEMD